MRSSTPDIGAFARLDFDRDRRTGFGETVYGPGKTPEQLAGIFAAFRRRGKPVLATRVSAEQAAAFVDVDSTNPYPDERTPHATEILWLASEGISTGWPTGDGRAEFRGMDTVKRQDMAAFLHRIDPIVSSGGAG